MSVSKKPMVLVILDAMAIVKNSRITPFLVLKPRYGCTVGQSSAYPDRRFRSGSRLPDRQMGNSEVGHVNLGAGASCIRT